MTTINPEAVAQAQAAYEKAQEAQGTARAALDALNSSLATWRKAFDDAKKILDQSKPALTIAKAQLQRADADVAIAKAELAKLAPEKVANTGNGKGTDQSSLQSAVMRILRAAAPNGLSLDEIYNKLQVEGVQMAGAKPRENLTAYIGRWSKVDGCGIENRGRGVWGTTLADEAPATVPAFLAPAPEAPAAVVVDTVTPPTTQVPEFLTPPVSGTPEVAGPEGLSLLPEGFPGRDALTAAGLVNLEDLADKTHDQLRRIKGIGAETARNILAALGRSEA